MPRTGRPGAGSGKKAATRPDDPSDAAAPDRHEQDMVDLGSESSFPASDPPSYMGGTAVAGPPPHDGAQREPVSKELVDPVSAAVPNRKRGKNNPGGGRSS